MHSAKRQVRILFDHLQAAGVRDLVISPGSRNAPLIIEAQARPEFIKTVIPDERSAGFVALGMAEATGRPVAVVSTSGTAVLNYHPAVAEAFYRRLPLIVLSADRPAYRIDKGEGQSIRQKGVLDHHTIAGTNICEQEKPEQWETKFRDIFRSLTEQNGPVHINLPFDEPLYETVDDVPQDLPAYQKPEAEPLDDQYLDRLEKVWSQAERKMIIVAQGQYDDILAKQMERLAQLPDTVVLTENVANVRVKNVHEHIDRLIFPLSGESWKAYAPDLVLTVGNNIISKKIKYLLRDPKPASGHWHIGQHYITPDTFDSLTDHIKTTPEMFFSQWLFRVGFNQTQSHYAKLWQDVANQRNMRHRAFADQVPWSDWQFYDILRQSVPAGTCVHWANSTVVRYAQLFDFNPGVCHSANRGTSGIDGSHSTAVGFARRTDSPVLHVTGDLSFLYDSNALWAGWPDNLKTIVIKNGGGDIFRFIPGPASVPDYERYFVAPPKVYLEKLAGAFGLQVLQLTRRSRAEAKNLIGDFLQSKTHRVLVVDTTQEPNAQILKAYFESLKG